MPTNTSTQDIQIARERMEKAGRKPEGQPYTIKTFLGFLTSWKTLLFTLIFTMQPFGSQPLTAFVFWLKAHNKKGKPIVYTIAQIVC
jgi:ACS family pantothenate transporter-like MFS transporter